MLSTNKLFTFLFTISMLFMAGCGKDDEAESVERPIETIQKGYFKTPVNQQDIDNTFIKYGVIGKRSMSLYSDRWCAFVGDSMTVFISKMMDGFANYARIDVCLDGTRYPYCEISCFREKQDDLYRLVEDKPIVRLRNALIIPVRNQNGADDCICWTAAGGGCGIRKGIFDYVLDADKASVVFHTDDGNYYLWEIFSVKDPQKYNREIISN